MFLKKIGSIAISLCAISTFAACGDDSADAPSDNGGGNGTASGTASGTANGNAAACETAMDPMACTSCLQTAESLGETIDALVTCTCQNCAAELEACYEGGTPEENQKCQAVVDCGQTNGCRGTECYCGVGVDISTCLNDGPMGPCREEIAVAAGCEGMTDAAQEAVCVQMARDTAGSTLAKASAVGACSTGDPGLMPPAEGNCSDI